MNRDMGKHKMIRCYPVYWANRFYDFKADRTLSNAWTMTIFLQEQILKVLPALPAHHKRALSMCCTDQHRRILEVLAVLIPNPKCTAFLVSHLPDFTVSMKENQQMRLLHQSLARQALALRKRPHDLHCKNWARTV